MAIFPNDVIRSHRAFIENRRTLRPTDEYRAVIDAEWNEFEEHFAKRKIAIGDCMRAMAPTASTNTRVSNANSPAPTPPPDPACSAPAPASWNNSTKPADATGSVRPSDSPTCSPPSTRNSDNSPAPTAAPPRSSCRCRVPSKQVRGDPSRNGPVAARSLWLLYSWLATKLMCSEL
jgi:hypothetical protein